MPRGERTFVAEDLGEDGFVTIINEEPFRGVRVVRSKGHVAQTGFVNGKSAEICVVTVETGTNLDRREQTITSRRSCS